MAGMFISANEHVIESPDVWTRRLSKDKWGDRIPHVVTKADGTEVWLIDGKEEPLVGRGSASACSDDHSEEPIRWADIPKVITDPASRSSAMAEQGVDHAVLYPSVAGIGGEVLAAIEDPELELACVQAYNDWLVETWGSNPKFIVQCVVPLSSGEAAAAEIRRSVAKGHRGVLFPGIPDVVRKGAPHLNDASYDPVWKACEELKVPVCFQAGVLPQMALDPYEGYPPAVQAAFRAIARPATITSVLSNFLVSRIPERFPGLKAVFAESALGLMSFSVEGSDYGFRMWKLDQRFDHKARPSTYFKNNCYVVGWYDRKNLEEVARYLGTSSLLWTTKFPMGTSPWPNTQKQVAKSFEGMSADDRQRVLWSNAAELYGIA